MSAPATNPYPALWKARAAELDKRNYFREYDPTSYKEVIHKGYLGRHNPADALKIARSAVDQGYARYQHKFLDEIRDHYGVTLIERRPFLLSRLNEVQPDAYQPPFTLEQPPGYPYIFYSRDLHADLYLKFQITPDRRRSAVLFWSCHPPVRTRSIE